MIRSASTDLASPSLPVRSSSAADASASDRVAFVQLPAERANGVQPRSWTHLFRFLSDFSAPLNQRQIATLTAAVVALLHRYAQQNDIALDVSVDATPARRVERTLRFEVDAAQSFALLVERTQAALRAASDLPVPERAGSNVGLAFARFRGDLVTALEAGVSDAHDLHFMVHEANGLAVLLVSYDAARFAAATIERLSDAFVGLLSAAQLDAETSLYALPLLASTEVEAIERACEGREIEPAPDPRVSACESILQRFERFARQQPDAVAVSFQGRALSYRELDERADRLARQLIASGVEPERMVGMCLAPSLEVVVCMLAIFKAGGVYVPLDPTYPTALLATILDEAKPVLVLTDEKSQRALPEGAARLCVDAGASVRERHESHAGSASESGLADGEQSEISAVFCRLPGLHIDQPAYVLYTSGTTGRPKGVVATHRNLAHYLKAARERYGFCGEDVFCSLARYTFSISFFELLSPLGCGGQLLLLERDEVLDPTRLARVLEQVTVMHAGPSLLGSLFRHLRAHAPGRTFANVRHASSGGDMVPQQILAEMGRVFSAAEIFVIYGCTEVSCMGCTFPVARGSEPSVNFVGKPFAGVAIRVLDVHGNLVPFGVVGEIYFAGEGVARRYLKRPELTSEKFICLDGRRFYRTGDLGRLHADGNLEILGRRDFQVQLRGIRVELAGIEQTVRELGLASEVAVIAAARSEHDVRLVAFVANPRERDAGAFRRALAARLPDYMLPQAVITLDALPLSANGKLDRRRLAELALSAPQAQSAKEKTAPESSVERAVAEAFAEVLAVAEVGLDDDFFDLGGHSLTAVLLMEQLQNRLGLSLSPGLVFEQPTVRALAQAAGSVAPGEQKPILLSASADHPALFMLLGVHLYRELARQLEGQYSVFGVYAGSELALLDGDQAPSVRELAADYVAMIRRQQPHGPYRLGGMSFGGIVAYEVAQQLEQSGEEVESLVLIDAVLPEPRLAKVLRLAALPGAELARELSERVRARLSGAARNEVPLDFIKHQDDAQLRQLEDRRQEAYRAAAATYRRDVRSFHRHTCLIVAGKRLNKDRLQDPRCGFATLVPELSVHTVDAEHLALLEAPAVSEVAAFVGRELRGSVGRRCVLPPVALQWKVA